MLLVLPACFAAMAPSLSGQEPAAPTIDHIVRATTPDVWAERARRVPACEVAPDSVTTSDTVEQQWHVDSLYGSIALPREFRLAASPAGHRHGYRWVSGDSSSISLEGNRAIGGLAMGGGLKPVGGTTCAIVLIGRPALTQAMKMLRSGSSDTLYFDAVSTFARTGESVSLFAQSHSPKREAQLLAFVKNLHVDAAPAH